MGGGGRPKRTDLPEGIGREPDEVVALREGVTRQAIQYLRNQHQIPPASEPWRGKWFDRHGIDPGEWEPREWDGSF